MKKLFSLYFSFLILLLVSACLDAPAPVEHRTSPANNQQIREDISRDINSQIQEMANQRATHKIALLVPLSGKAANVGKSISDAAQMALYESNNHDFQIITIDTGDTPVGAEQAMQQAIAQNVEVVLGPVFSDSVLRVAPMAREKGIKIFSFSNNKAVAGNGVYIMGLIPDQQIERILSYTAKTGVDGFSAVLPNNLFGSQVRDIMQKQVNWNGGVIRKQFMYSPQLPEFATLGEDINNILKIKGVVADRSSEAILVPEAGYNLKQIIISLEKEGLNNNTIRFLGTALWDNRDTIGNSSLNGAWFASPPYELFDEFNARFRSIFNYKPEDIAAIGYDSVNLVMELANSDYSTSEIHRSYGFNGIRGPYRFDSQGLSQRVYAIYEIRNGSAHVIDQAPTSFSGGLF